MVTLYNVFHYLLILRYTDLSDRLVL